MKKMLYNIYSTISDKKFLLIAQEMAAWELEMTELLVSDGWKKTKPVIENDALIIDFTKRGDIHGNIGIVFDDKPEGSTFSFYVTKSYDEEDNRFFLRKNIFENKKRDDFRGQVRHFTLIALELYNGWDKQDIKDLGEKDSLN